MSSGLYPDMELIERYVSGAISATTLGQVFVPPVDLDIIGMVLYVGTAPGSTNSFTVNVSNYPTSQNGGSGTSVGAYNLWTATNVPKLTGTATNNLTVVQTAVVKNVPYALNYPLPGPSGTVGYTTAQSTAQTTEVPVTAPPTAYNFGIGALVAPDNTYTDYNGNTAVAASQVHAGDILSFVVGGTVGSAANLEIVLYAQKR